MSNIEIDGRVVESGRDPPGQRSTYIPPGDTFREIYRLTTYVKFPEFCPVNPCALAKHGFYYTGYKDRVKCFQCGLTVENWVVGDDPTWERWHADDCELMAGRSLDNVPIAGGNQLRQPREASQNHSRRADEGRPDLTRVSTSQSSVQSASTATSERSREVDQTANLFPCSDPVNPHMRNTAQRLQTFVDNMQNWPSHRIAATPNQMVEAGLYYLGERDRVKCWYCNGGLQNWDTNDDPWFEHAKWFPSCEFLLQRKGPAYVHNVVAQFPNLNRPTPVNAASALNLPQTVTSGLSPSRSNMPIIVDPREDVRKRERKVDEEMQRCPFVEEAKVMGFTEIQIRFAILRRFEEVDSPYPSFASMVDYIVENQNQIPTENEAASSETPTTSGASANRETSIVEELRNLKKLRVCKVCELSNASVVLLPCGHLATCANCSKDIRHCPICKALVREAINSFIV